MSEPRFVIARDGRGVPAIDVEQMREVDRAMIEDYRIELIQMMENAGRNLADLARRRFSPRSVTVLAGSGGNGGGGLVAARHLHNRGTSVSVSLASENLSPVAAHQLDILTRMGVEVRDEPVAATLVIDALIGYSLDGPARGRYRDLIEWANLTGSSVLALDTPSGLDLTTGTPHPPCVRADATMTLALPKVGLARAQQVGELFLADISVPASLFSTMGLVVPPVFESDAIRELSVQA